MNIRKYFLTNLLCLAFVSALFSQTKTDSIYTKVDTIYASPDTVLIDVVETVYIYDTVKVSWNAAFSAGAELRNTTCPMGDFANTTTVFNLDLSHLANKWYIKGGLQYTKLNLPFSYDFWEEIWINGTPTYEQRTGSPTNTYQYLNIPLSAGIIHDMNNFSLTAGVGLGAQFAFQNSQNIIVADKTLLSETAYLNKFNLSVHSDARLLYYLFDLLAVGLEIRFNYYLLPSYSSLNVSSTQNYALGIGIVVSYSF